MEQGKVRKHFQEINYQERNFRIKEYLIKQNPIVDNRTILQENRLSLSNTYIIKMNFGDKKLGFVVFLR